MNKELWQRFEGWLSEHAPADAAWLLPPATAAEIDHLEEALGFPLHPDLKDLLKLHNGTSSRSGGAQPGAFLFGYSPLATEGIIAAHRNVLAVLEGAREEDEEDLVLGIMVHPRWVPFAEDICGDIVFLDHREQHEGQIGLLSYGSPQYEPLWPSMDVMWEQVYASTEGGTPLRPVDMQPSVEDGRILRWSVVLG
ncbi:SMI1/KNR4 family protein [Streptantibioticus ferralitis]|uniref:SMI1/KNR4 family protein n=1 Tax=Streptantibioticus ferralitis TaxID=236510 RepID=A0ABT5Z5J2_9ACTN|nr:SMI1/KNR4 family protein [Streptantibioticus ferralitis]MDF2259102.1 SMI1/KNR4 family protein [Streptantibioticus ferralitis]